MSTLALSPNLLVFPRRHLIINSKAVMMGAVENQATLKGNDMDGILSSISSGEEFPIAKMAERQPSWVDDLNEMYASSPPQPPSLPLQREGSKYDGKRDASRDGSVKHPPASLANAPGSHRTQPMPIPLSQSSAYPLDGDVKPEQRGRNLQSPTRARLQALMQFQKHPAKPKRAHSDATATSSISKRESRRDLKKDKLHN
ncbi:hypothetical protein CYLTODRAFT_86669 [Cylindrobasidium torrendii FP15055 ss-10]|uniref:Uncharacterized protein n=1 Tax=Cylindrobasidium torrendii FP15055 ss-10 TaxID=1314674 RepID=A0A0D7BMX8_9AGAR|nr:hypothetical protein CYLTODRAFT_86669 [Cylindrobasidium torrendii FP15055 ss-10]